MPQKDDTYSQYSQATIFKEDLQDVKKMILYHGTISHLIDAIIIIYVFSTLDKTYMLN